MGGGYIFLGDHTRIYPYSRIECFNNISGESLTPCLKIGNNVLMGRNTTVLCAKEIVIEDDVLFASYCFVSDENHGTDLSTGQRYEEQKLVCKPVYIGRNCWIGEKVIILPGVTIGENTIIGAGSVVTSSIPPNVIAAGCSARVVKRYNFVSKMWERVDKEDK